MKISISSQLLQIALSWILGIASGFLYDAFKVIRRESSRKALSAFLDMLFCLIVCFALFVAGMDAGEGSPGLFMLIFAFIGFCCYMLLLSDRIFSFLHRVFCKLKTYIKKVLSPVKKALTFIEKKLKNIFSEIKSRVKKHGGQNNAEEKIGHNSGYCNYGDDSLWHVQSDNDS